MIPTCVSWDTGAPHSSKRVLVTLSPFAHFDDFPAFFIASRCLRLADALNRNAAQSLRPLAVGMVLLIKAPSEVAFISEPITAISKKLFHAFISSHPLGSELFQPNVYRDSIHPG
jgi:hypothetical protein